MTKEKDRAEICAELARAMGIPEDQWPLRCDSSKIVRQMERVPPDPFTDPAASRALVGWLATQSAEIWGNFSALVIDSAIPFDQQAYADWEMVTRATMTAKLETIARAAYDAIKEKT